MVIAAKGAVNELEGLVEDAIVELGTATKDLAHLCFKDSRNVLDLPGTTSDEVVSSVFTSYICILLLAILVYTLILSFKKIREQYDELV